MAEREPGRLEPNNVEETPADKGRRELREAVIEKAQKMEEESKKRAYKGDITYKQKIDEIWADENIKSEDRRVAMVNFLLREVEEKIVEEARAESGMPVEAPNPAEPGAVNSPEQSPTPESGEGENREFAESFDKLMGAVKDMAGAVAAEIKGRMKKPTFKSFLKSKTLRYAIALIVGGVLSAYYFGGKTEENKPTEKSVATAPAEPGVKTSLVVTPEPEKYEEPKEEKLMEFDLPETVPAAPEAEEPEEPIVDRELEKEIERSFDLFRRPNDRIQSEGDGFFVIDLGPNGCYRLSPEDASQLRVAEENLKAGVEASASASAAAGSRYSSSGLLKQDAIPGARREIIRFIVDRGEKIPKDQIDKVMKEAKEKQEEAKKQRGKYDLGSSGEQRKIATAQANKKHSRRRNS